MSWNVADDRNLFLLKNWDFIMFTYKTQKFFQKLL